MPISTEIVEKPSVWWQPSEQRTISIHLFNDGGEEISGGGYEPFVTDQMVCAISENKRSLKFDLGTVTWKFTGRLDGEKDEATVYGAAIYIDSRYFGENWFGKTYTPLVAGDRVNVNFHFRVNDYC